MQAGMKNPFEKRTLLRASLLSGTFLLLVWVQFSGPYLAGEDPYYHAAMSSLYAREGLLSSFPWTQFSLQKDGVNDRHFLYHIAMIPFLWKNPIQGAKAYCVVTAVSCVVVFLLLLESLNVEKTWFWLLVLFSAGPFFWYRFSVARPQIVAVTLALLCFRTVCAEKPLGTFLVSAVSFLFYSSAHLAVPIALFYGLVAFLKEKRFVWRPLFAASLGLAAGLVVHPHFPSIVRTWLVQNFSVLYHSLAGTKGLNFGAELGPPSADAVLKALAIPLFICTGTVFWSALAGRALEKVTLTAFLCASSFLALTLFSKRFVEYAAPFLVLLGALGFRDVRRSFEERMGKATRFVFFLLTFAAAALSVRGIRETREVIAGTGGPRLKPAALWLLSHSKKGDIVFTCDWDDFRISRSGGQ